MQTIQIRDILSGWVNIESIYISRINGIGTTSIQTTRWKSPDWNLKSIIFGTDISLYWAFRVISNQIINNSHLAATVHDIPHTRVPIYIKHCISWIQWRTLIGMSNKRCINRASFFFFLFNPCECLRPYSPATGFQYRMGSPTLQYKKMWTSATANVRHPVGHKPLL